MEKDDKSDKIAAALFRHKNPGRSWVRDLREGDKEEWRAMAKAVLDALEPPKPAPKAAPAVAEHAPAHGKMFGRKK